MDLPDNSLPQKNFLQSLESGILKHKNPILAVLILTVSALSIGILAGKQTTLKNQTENVIIETQGTTACPYGGTRICDEYGVCYDYCYDGTVVNPNNPPTPNPNEPPHLTAGQLNALANSQPGVETCAVIGNTSQRTCVVSDGTTTYSPGAYSNAYPPTATPAPTTKPAATNTGTGSSGGSGTGGSSGTSNNQQDSPSDNTALVPTATPTPNIYAPHSNYPSGTPTPTLKPCQMTHGGSYNPPTQENPCAMPTQGPTSTPKPTPTPVPPVPEGARCVTNRNRLTTCYDSSNNVVLTYTSDFETITLPSQAPNEARSAFTVYITSIGTNRSLGQNDTPISGQNLEFQFINSQNQAVKTGVAQVTAKQAQTPTGMGYTGQISLGTTLSAGNYKAKIRLDNTLWKAANITLTPGVLTTIPVMELILGDLDQDNRIGLLDYNILISCYGSKQCAQKAQADLNLDGKVDELDLNILYASFRTREGD